MNDLDCAVGAGERDAFGCCSSKTQFSEGRGIVAGYHCVFVLKGVGPKE